MHRFRNTRLTAALLILAACGLIAVIIVILNRGEGTKETAAEVPSQTESPSPPEAPVSSGIKIEALLHNSWEDRYRRPFGAVEQGTEVTLSFRTAKEDVDKVTLLWEDEETPMTKETSDANYDYYVWKRELTEIGEYRYAFRLDKSGSVMFYMGETGPGEALAYTEAGTPYSISVYKQGYRTPDWLKLSVTYQILPDRFRNGDPSNDKAVPFFYADTELQYPRWDDYDHYEDSRYNSVNEKEYAVISERWGWDENWFNETYGGDLRGIEEKLDYLQALGVKAIYLNPIFLSLSSHKYDVADFDVIDPRFGTEEDFKRLAEEAKKRGMFLIMDGVFNHVSNDSKYFNLYGKKYETHELGAYEAWVLRGVRDGNEAAARYYNDWYGNSYFSSTFPDTFRGKSFYEPYVTGNKEIVSPYDDWFTIYEDGGYAKWEGIDNFVQLNAPDGSHLQLKDYADRIIHDSDSVARQWIQNGSSGWRLDVSPIIATDFWEAFRSAIKGENAPEWPNGEPVMIAENWNDSTLDFIHGTFDSTQNYLFRSSVISYVLDEPYNSRYDFGGVRPLERWEPIDAMELNRQLMRTYEKYPKETSFVLLNALSNHDVPRILTVFGYIERQAPLYPGVRDYIAMELDISVGVGDVVYVDDFHKQGFVTKDIIDRFVQEHNELAEKRMLLATIIQMSYPGSPTIYYGDEAGVPGHNDPDNRRQMNWKQADVDYSLWESVAAVTNLRSKYQVLKTGDFIPLSAEGDSPIYVFGRRLEGDRDALGWATYTYNYDTRASLEIADHNGRAVIAVNKDRSRELEAIVDVSSFAPDGTVFEDRLNGGEYTVSNGQLRMVIGPLEGRMLIQKGVREVPVR